MALIVKTQNNPNGALNNALAGFERGLGNGIGFGLEASRQRKAAEEAAARTQLAREQAMRIDQELQREAAERAAAQEANVLTAEGEGSNMTGALNAGMKMGPGVAAAVGTAKQDKWGRIKEIVSRMDADAGRLFLQDARERERENVLETERGRLRDDIARWSAEGGGRSNPEDSPWLDPEEVANGDAEFQMGVDRLVAMAAHPKSDPLQIRAMWGELRANKIKAHGKAQARMKSYQEMFNRAETDPNAAARTPEQQEQIDTLLAAYKESPELYDSKQAQMQFKERFNDALEGYTRIGNDRIKIEDAELFMRQKVENEKLRGEVLREQAKASKALAEQRMAPEATGMKQKDLLDLAAKYDGMSNEMGISAADQKRYRGLAEQYRQAAQGGKPVPGSGPVAPQAAAQIDFNALGSAFEGAGSDEERIQIAMDALRGAKGVAPAAKPAAPAAPAAEAPAEAPVEPQAAAPVEAAKPKPAESKVDAKKELPDPKKRGAVADLYSRAEEMTPEEVEAELARFEAAGVKIPEKGGFGTVGKDKIRAEAGSKKTAPAESELASKSAAFRRLADLSAQVKSGKVDMETLDEAIRDYESKYRPLEGKQKKIFRGERL